MVGEDGPIYVPAPRSSPPAGNDGKPMRTQGEQKANMRDAEAIAAAKC